ncbi:3-methyladenine DNA glycosylase [Gemmobacter aquaticus]|uniref:3-methyladenine DNA glycosylase n=1 Tax=Gemmobacter aquaticus TaxID=490185 RepID=A0A917YJ61_9RHOB|nr:DNA-3-methyladenine glycosylase I [Gemmobacter aquaticus]GGO31388.1 3-methyladenine DNA glycosylase [Gemmobacter aquaticus]
MRSFEEILTIAAERKGGADKVLAGVMPYKTAGELASIPDDRWLAMMARGIFQAGISWTVVEAKWPGIEEAFAGFDVGRLSMMDDGWLDALLVDTRVIRSGAKIAAIRDNAVFIRRVNEAEGGFARKVADWPAGDFAGLLDWLTTTGSRLGGNTGAYMLRQMGKEGYLLSKDVVARLVAEGVIGGPPTSRKAMAAVQAAFDRWRTESGQSLNTISRVLAQSIG